MTVTEEEQEQEQEQKQKQVPPWLPLWRGRNRLGSEIGAPMHQPQSHLATFTTFTPQLDFTLS